MFLKKPSASTDPRLRSLLQKAVRRGADHLVQATTRTLIYKGDTTWLRSRTVVITFEEAWPLAQNLVLTKDQLTREKALLSVSHTSKQKDAAGLGALAFAFHEGDHSMLDLVPSKHAIVLVSEALNRPHAFLEWALTQSTTEESHHIILAARKYLPAATWGWDKATILAAAYFAACESVPILSNVYSNISNFPYWVALDKHTPEGKEVFKKIASHCGITYRQLIWTSFYFESATVNSLEPSLWFETERSWRLRKAGLNDRMASELWCKIQATVARELFTAAEKLRLQVEIQSTNQGNLFR